MGKAFRPSSWGMKFFDVIFMIFVVIIVCAGIQLAFPSSGLAHAIHQGFHFLAILLGWIAGGLTALAQLLNQL
jgi:hypothetical protein